MPALVVAAILVVTAAATARDTPQPPPLAFGTNVGHWLSQSKLDRAEMAAFFTEADIARIKGWGMDHVRIPVDAPLIAGTVNRERVLEEGLSWIDRAVAWTRNAGLTLVLDMHHLPGHGFMTEHTNSIWADGPDRRHAVLLWRALAERYRGQPHVVFELLNEPVAPEGQHDLWHALAGDLLGAVRAVNRDNWVMIGSNRWSHVDTFAALPKFDDPRIVYTFHLYDPFLFTHQRASWAPPDVANLPGPVPYPGPLPKALLHTPFLLRQYGWMAERSYDEAYLRERLQPVLAFRERHRVPVYCGEFGVVNNAPAEDRLRWYRDVIRLFRGEAIGFANWNYKSNNFGLVGTDGRPDDSLVEAVTGAGETISDRGGAPPPFDEAGDVGSVRQPGSVQAVGPGAYEVAGSGANIWGTQDEFHFVSKRVSGDLALVTDVAFLASGGTPDPHRKAGYMVRVSREVDAPYVHGVVHGDGLISLQYRAQQGGPTAEIQSPVRAPATLRVERHGDVFSLEVRPPGGVFQAVGAIVLPLPDEVLAGLAISAHAADRIESARFSNVSLEARPRVDETERITESTLETLDIDTGQRHVVYRVREHFEAPNWSRDGRHFLFNQGGFLYTLPVDGGTPTKVDTGSVDGCNNDHGYSPDGTLIVLSCGRGGSRIYIMPASGGQPRRLTEGSPSYWHGWSPDGSTLAYVARRDGDFDIYTIPVTGGPERRITSAKGLDDGPDYTPDGQWVYFNSERTGTMRIWRMRPDGSDQQQITDDPQYGDWFPHPSPDGKWIVFLSFDASVQGHPPNKDVVLRLMPLDGSTPPRVVARLFGGQGTINVPSWAPDSRRFAFVSYRLLAP